MKILVLTKRQYMAKDLIDDHFGRFWELPFELAALGHEDKQLSARCADPALHGGTVADVIRMAHNARSGIERRLGATVRRAIIDNNHFRLTEIERVHSVEQFRQNLSFVIYRNNDGDSAMASHGVDRPHGRGLETST